MKLIHCSKYILFMSFISCTSLLFTNSTNRYGIKIADSPSKTVIESTENGYVPDSKESANDEGTEGKIEYPTLQKLPFYDTNGPIVISPLSYERIVTNIK